MYVCSHNILSVLSQGQRKLGGIVHDCNKKISSLNRWLHKYECIANGRNAFMTAVSSVHEVGGPFILHRSFHRIFTSMKLQLFLFTKWKYIISWGYSYTQYHYWFIVQYIVTLAISYGKVGGKYKCINIENTKLC